MSHRYKPQSGPKTSRALARTPEGQLVVNIEALPDIIPEKSFYADAVVVATARDGMTICFGKLEPAFLSGGASRLAAVLELSFPHKSFYNQLYKSVVSELEPGRLPFRASVDATCAKLNLADDAATPAKLTGTDSTKTAAFRVNAAIMSLHDDDAAVDFFYLDAIALRALSMGAPLPELHGIVRVVLSPFMLKQFLDRCIEEAEQLPERIPDLIAEDLPAVSGGKS